MHSDKKPIRRDMKRRRLVLELMDKTGISEPWVYHLLEHGTEPANPLVRKVWARIRAKHAA